MIFSTETHKVSGWKCNIQSELWRNVGVICNADVLVMEGEGGGGCCVTRLANQVSPVIMCSHLINPGSRE